MIALPPPTPALAERILRQVFGHIKGPFAFRLWNGQEVRLGQGEPVCTAVIKTPETFLQLLRDPSPGKFARSPSKVIGEFPSSGGKIVPLAPPSESTTVLDPGASWKVYRCFRIGGSLMLLTMKALGFT